MVPPDRHAQDRQERRRAQEKEKAPINDQIEDPRTYEKRKDEQHERRGQNIEPEFRPTRPALE